MMSRLIPAFIVLLLLFLLIRFRNLPEAFLALGVLWILDIWVRSIILPLVKRSGGPVQGPPIRPRVYTGIIATLALGIGIFFFIKFSETPPLPEILKGHAGQVNVLAFTPAAGRFISAGEDKIVRLWRYDEPQKKFVPERQYPEAEKSTYDKYNVTFTSVAYQPGGTLVAMGSSDGTIRLWDYREGIIVRQLLGHKATIRVLLFNTDGSMLISGSDDKTVRFWQVPDGTEVRVLKDNVGATEKITALAFRPDKKMLAIASADKTIGFWDFARNTYYRVTGHNEPVIGLAFSSDGQHLFSITDKRAVKRWSFDEGKLSWSAIDLYKADEKTIAAAAFSRDAKTFATADQDKSVRLWKNETTASPAPARDCKGLSEAATTIAFDATGGQLIAAGKNTGIQVWKLSGDNACNPERKLGHGGEIGSIVFSPDNKSLASASTDKSVRIWETMGDKELYKFDGAADEITQLAWGNNVTAILALSRDGSIRMWNRDDGTLMRELNWKAYRVTAMAANPKNADEIVLGNVNGVLGIWKLNETKPREISAHISNLTSAAYGNDDKLLATGGGDHLIRVWNLAELRDRNNAKPGSKELKGHTGLISLLVFSPDNNLLGSASLDDRTVRIWKLDKPLFEGSNPLKLNQTTNGVLTMAFGKDNKTLVTAGNDNVIRVWNVDDGNLLSELVAPAQPVLGLGVANDESIRAAGAVDSGTSIQPWSVGNLKEIRDMFSPFSRAYLLINTELTRLFWASALGLFLAGAIVLGIVGLYSMIAARAMYAPYPGFDFIQAWKAMMSIELGTHKVQQRVAKGEIVQVQGAAGNLARIGGPGVLIVEEGNVAVLMQSGRVTNVAGMGVTWLRHFERVHLAVPLMPQGDSVSVKDLMTHDRMILREIEVKVSYRVDPGNQTHSSGAAYPYDDRAVREKIWTPEGGNWTWSARSAVEGAVRDLVAQYTFEDLIAIAGDARQRLLNDIRGRISVRAQDRGVQVLGVGLGAIRVTDEVRQALEEKNLAEVRRQTEVINAEAKKDAKTREGEGEAIAYRMMEQQRNEMRERMMQEILAPLRADGGANDPAVAARYMSAIERFLEIIENLTEHDDFDVLRQAIHRERAANAGARPANDRGARHPHA